MRSIDRLLFLRVREEQRWRRYVTDTLLAAVLALLVTLFIYGLSLYPKIPNISFLYLLVVLGFASTRGLYAAIVASVVAFFSFDYFLVRPLYTLTVGSLEEWLALFIFLVTAIITGELASALRQRVEEVTQREAETRALFELVSATTREESLERQLDIIAHLIVTNFAFAGITDCAILLPEPNGKLVLRADVCQPVQQMRLSPEEEKLAESVMMERQPIDLYDGNAPVSSHQMSAPNRFRRIVTGGLPGYSYVRMIPLQLGQRVVGVMRLLMEEKSRRFLIERNLETGKGRLNPQTAFFWTFLDQATSVIERERLHREALQIELLRRTDALRSALLSSVSHDLRTPLASIKAAASSLLQEDVHWDEETRRSFAVAIEREADRLNRLVGNLLDMSRIEGGALKPEKEWYPIEELIHDVSGHMQFVLQGREVKTSIPDNLPPVELDYLQIDQVLTNLIENAARYTPQGSPIEITAQVVDGQIMVSVADRGPGIPPQYLERIFDKFYRVSTVRKGSAMGSGLGLAVCRGLVEAHGGRIWAENREGGGAVFRFTLPLGKVEQ